MAIGAVTVHVNSGAAATSFTSASFTPSANSILIAYGNARTGAAAIPSITDSLGGTWTTVPGTNLSVGAGNLKTILAYQVIGGSPASMTVTVTSAGAIACSVMVVGYTGASNDTSNVGINQNTAGDPAPSNSAMAATSTGLAFNSQNAGAAPTATPSSQGYTSIINAAPATNLRHTLFTDQSSPANSVSWASTGTDSLGILWELKEAVSGYTGTIAQTATHTSQALSGTVTPPAVTGTASQTVNHPTQALSGTATPPAIAGTIVQTHKPPTQALTGSFTAAGSFSGTIAQTLQHPTQALAGTVTAPAVTGAIIQTGPHPSQVLNGFTPTQEPERRQGGGFANWSPPLDKKRRKAWQEAEEARHELRASLERLFRGEPDEQAPARTEALAAVSALSEARRELAGVAELAGFRAEIQQVERAVLRALASRTINQNRIFGQMDGLDLAQAAALEAFMQEEMAIVALLA